MGWLASVSQHQHIRLPITLAADGSFRTVAEDSIEEVLQNVTVILRTRLEERLATPDLGVPDPTFVGFDTAAALDMARMYEPRADLQVIERALTALGVQTTTVTVGRRETT
jgi:phage baseplate assembly protein W